MLIAAKADLAHIDINGNQALHVAAKFDQKSSNAYIAFPSKNGNTKWHTSEKPASSCEMSRVLIEEGALLTAVDADGNTPLEIVKLRGEAFPDYVTMLEAAGAVLPEAVAAAYAFVAEHIATTRGFRFAVTKAADEEAPPGLDKQIYDAAARGKLDELLGLCQEWAGHAVIDAYIDEVRRDEYTNIFRVSVFYIYALHYCKA